MLKQDAKTGYCLASANPLKSVAKKQTKFVNRVEVDKKSRTSIYSARTYLIIRS